jgi:hypothetical protein
MEFIVGKSRHTSGANKIAQMNFDGTFQEITERVKNETNNIEAF